MKWHALTADQSMSDAAKEDGGSGHESGEESREEESGEKQDVHYGDEEDEEEDEEDEDERENGDDNEDMGVADLSMDEADASDGIVDDEVFTEEDRNAILHDMHKTFRALERENIEWVRRLGDLARETQGKETVVDFAHLESDSGCAQDDDDL